MKEPMFKEGKDRDDPRLWRINELPQSSYRSRWSLHRVIILGVIVLGIWFAAGTLFNAWGLGLALAPLGGFLVIWGIIQEILALISMETFDDSKGPKK